MVVSNVSTILPGISVKVSNAISTEDNGTKINFMLYERREIIFFGREINGKKKTTQMKEVKTLLIHQ